MLVKQLIINILCGCYIISEIKSKENSQRIGSIDIGVNNLASIAFNVSDVNPLLIDGKPLKNMNQYFNKKKAGLISKLPKGIKSSKRLDRMSWKRNNLLDNYMYNISNVIVKYFIENKIDTCVLGYNKYIKFKSNIGKRNNQNFQSIPFHKFRSILSNKLEKVGILYIEHEESYTSKCSFVDYEFPSKKETYVGKRVKRGCFKTENEILVNSDINGALNILVKSFGNDIFDESTIRTKYFSNIKKYSLTM